MPLGVAYLVEIDLEVKGDLPGQMGKVDSALSKTESKANKLGSELGKVGKSLADGFTGVVESVGSQLANLAKVGLVAAVGATTYGVVGLNKELETTRVSLAAVLNSNGLTSSIEGGMERAASWVSQMKKDARDLPGEFSDLLGIVQSGAGAAFQAGLDDISFEKLAANAMAASKALSVPMDQAGRELAHLLQGKAGSQNVLGMRLGLTAENYNNKSQTDQIKMLTDAIGKFQPAIAAFGQTFDAQSSTFVDNVKTFVGTATHGLFERVVGALSEVNAWFEKNQTTVKLWADKVGQMLVDAWDDGRKIVEEWGPSIVNFAENFYTWFMKTWREAEPYVKDIAATVKGFLDNPQAFDRIESLLKLYAGAKVFSFGADMVSAGSGLYKAITKVDKVARAGSAAGKAAEGAAEAAEWAGALKAASVTGQAGEAIGAAGIGTTGLVAGVVAATVAALGAAGYEVYSAQQRSVTVDAKGGGAYGYSEGAQKFVDTMVDKAIRVQEKFAELEDATLPTIAGFSEAGDAASEFASIIRTLAASGDFEAIARINAGIMAREQEAAFAADDTARQEDFFRLNSAAMGLAAVKALDTQDRQAKEREKQRKAAAGQNVTNIGTITITISNNNAPGQVARDVMKHITNEKRYRRSSPNVFNAAAGR